jgi:hypothetical protein
MEQIIDAAQGVLDAEFLPQSALGVFGSQRADAVGLGGFGEEPLLEKALLGRRQLRRPTGLSFGSDRGEALIPVCIGPALHKRAAASQRPCDRRSVVAFKR